MNKKRFSEKRVFSNVSSYRPQIKLLISVLAGILCFIFSKYSIPLKTSGIEINVPWSVIFPFIISLAYGKKYALISGLAGGALYPF